ncbi:hypothetical protein ACFQZE_14925 [Paenibacillus sp. GCM10027627]|uniref:hypothetical protein n=1 Tax=unclassified Paenibacillus TaxID=185978 RepID=UPI0036332916
MKKKMFSLLVLSALFATSAAAGSSTVTGFSSGSTPTATQGTVTAVQGTSGGNDHAYASTYGAQSSNASTSFVSVALGIFYSLPGGDTGYVSTVGDSRFTPGSAPNYVVASLAAPNGDAIRAISAHYYYDPSYGSWSDSTQVYY